MSHDDILDMLDLPDEPGSDDPLRPADAGQRLGSASPTALKLDEWGLRRGRDLLANTDNERLRALPLGDNGLAEQACADFHGAAFEITPELNDACSDPDRREYLERLLETPETHALRTSTVLNEAAAELAATAFAEEFAKLAPKDENGVPRPGKLDGKKGIAREIALIGAAGRAVEKAKDEVQELAEASQGLGGDGADHGKMDPREAVKRFRRIRSSSTLKRIMELAGRYRRLAQSKQRQKTDHGYDDMVGVVTDGDVGRLLPHELARIADDDSDIELDALRRLVERQSMCREYRGVEKLAKGPVVVAVDSSSSMNGEKIANAKALALAMAWIARKQNRWCALVNWSDRDKRSWITLPPGKWDDKELLNWLETFCGGGTEPPLADMPAIYGATKAPAGKTDILLITDGVCCISTDEADGFIAWKKQVNARMTTLVIESDAESVRRVSDEVFCLPFIGTEQEAVGKVLNI